MIQKAASMGNWWLASSSQQHAHSCITCCTEFFGKTSNHPGDSAPLQHRFGTLWLLTFPKTKITFEREEISDCWQDSGNYNWEADGEWESCVSSQGAYFEGDWGVTVLCTMFLVSSSINVSIFHSTWLDTFWTDLICLSMYVIYISRILKYRIFCLYRAENMWVMDIRFLYNFPCPLLLNLCPGPTALNPESLRVPSSKRGCLWLTRT